MGKEIKVTKIISPYEIVLNVGRMNGIKDNSKFVVYGKGDLLVDPDTKEPLEQLEILRGKGKVKHLQDKICTIFSTDVLETPVTIRRTNRLNSMIASFYPQDTDETELRREQLPFKDVNVGDFARIII